MRSNYLFTTESVSEGHPDKVSDQISDAIVDLFLARDSEARVACETLVTTQRIVIGGEIRCKGAYDEQQFADTHGWAPGVRDEIEQVVRHVVQKIGYEQDGFHWQTASFENHLHGQSAHIAQGVDESGNKDEGAGDQGIMFGYATDETPDLLPATLYYSHRILERMARDRHEGAVSFLEPDKRSTIQLSHPIGIAEPRSHYVDPPGTEKEGVTAEKLEEVLPKLVRLTPKGIRTHLGLNKPIYLPTAAYGHFGRTPEGDLFSWEKTDLVDALKAAI